MAFTISNFKAKLANQAGGARPALYEIDINSISTALSFTASENLLVKTASIPAANIAPLAVNYAGRAYKWNGFRTYDNWTVTVLNDENFSARNKLMQWMRFMAGRLDGDRNVPFGDPSGTGGSTTSWIDGDATVKQLSTAGKVIQTYKFDYFWPTEIAGIPVDWSSDMIQEYSVTFAYDYWTHGDGSSSSINVVNSS